ncbi:MAG TPA: hypothetical protein PK298_00130 [Chitinophagaceae bacterium]|nr:hypothetical protein [Chitinophagaceae bacterium]HQX71269.1 hypothetical protein [Chitinophagaceae bacterium]
MKWRVYSSCLLVVVLFYGCGSNNNNQPAKEPTAQLDLKRGPVIACGSPGQEFGSVQFTSSCSAATQKDFNLGIALLHSFEYDEAEKLFAKVIDADPACAMGYWGVAMCNYHQVWPSPPLDEEMQKGANAIAIAQTLKHPSAIVTDYINAIALFYKNWTSSTHKSRGLDYEKAMEAMYQKYRGDKEVAIFYALSLVSVAEATDKTYSNQKKAAGILQNLYPGQPNHPGIVHYIIHSYDTPELAALALPAARKYASIAPSSAHAQHMPSHIFTRLGLWEEAIQSNTAAAASAKCYAEGLGIKGHWDEELHAIDYLIYARLQKGENTLAKQQVDYLGSFTEVYPVNFKVLYAFAASPSRYYLENKLWKDAAVMEFQPGFPWEKYPWQKAIVHFTRLLGAAHTGNATAARKEQAIMQQLHYSIIAQKDMYKANQVLIQIKTGEAWISYAEGKKEEAVLQMKAAAELEDKTGKSPVTPGEVLPTRQLLADMLLEYNKPADALTAYQADLKNHPNRFNSLYGAALASERSGDAVKARYYYQQLLSIANSKESDRAEIIQARSFLAKK